MTDSISTYNCYDKKIKQVNAVQICLTSKIISNAKSHINLEKNKVWKVNLCEGIAVMIG